MTCSPTPRTHTHYTRARTRFGTKYDLLHHKFTALWTSDLLSQQSRIQTESLLTDPGVTQEIFRRLLGLYRFDMARDVANRFADELPENSMDVVTLGEVHEHLRRLSSNDLLWCDQQQRQDAWAYCETHFSKHELPLPKRAAFFLSLARSFSLTDTTDTDSKEPVVNIFKRGQPASTAISELDILRVLELALKSLRDAQTTPKTKLTSHQTRQQQADEAEHMSALINLVSSIVILLQEVQVLHLSGQRPQTAKVVAYLPPIPPFSHQLSSLGKTAQHPPGRELQAICHDAIRSLCEHGNDTDAIVLAKAFAGDVFILQIVDFQTAVAMAASSLSSSDDDAATSVSTAASTTLLAGRANSLESLLRSKGINHLCELFLASGDSDIDLTYERYEGYGDNIAESTNVVWSHASTNATVAEQLLKFFVDPAQNRGDDLVDTTPIEEQWLQDVRLARGLCERIYSDWRSANLLRLPLSELVRHNPKYFPRLLQHCIDATHADNQGNRPGRGLNRASETACMLFIRTHTRKPAGWTAHALVDAVLGVLIPGTVEGQHPLWSRVQIEHFVALCHQPDAVGLLLLQALSQTEIKTRLEILIFAHHCFAQSVGDATEALTADNDNSKIRTSASIGDGNGDGSRSDSTEETGLSGSARVLKHILALVRECTDNGRLDLLVRLLLCAADHNNIEHIVSRLDTPQSLATVLCSEPSHSSNPGVWDIQAAALKRVLANYLRGQQVRDLDTATRVFIQLGMCRALADTLFETAEARLATLATQLKAITQEGVWRLQQDTGRFHELWEELLTVLQVCMSASEYFEKDGALQRALESRSVCALIFLQVRLLQDAAQENALLVVIALSQREAGQQMSRVDNYADAAIVATAYDLDEWPHWTEPL